MEHTSDKTCIVIGASHAGVNFAFNLRKEGWQGKIILFDSDPFLPYHRPPLSKSYLIDGDLNSNLLKTEESYTKENIELNLGVTVSKINREKKTVILKNEEVHQYDKLVLATGARPFLPPIRGLDSAHQLFPMRTAQDTINIKKALDTSLQKRVIIIGGGYIGLETAASLKKIGAEVTILEREKRVLSRVTAPMMSDYFMKLHSENGATILTNKNVLSIKNEGSYNTVFCHDNTHYEADIIIVGVGIKINNELATNADLEVKKGVKVNEFAQTSDANIYAIGDCTLHYNTRYKKYQRLESVQNAVDQSKIAAAHICEKENPYAAIPWFWSDQYDVKLQMVGLSAGYNDALLRQENEEGTSFSVWYFKDDELLAVDAVNNPRSYVLGTKFIKENTIINKVNLIDKTIPLKPQTLKLN